MREILFRGKRIDNGDWIEGSLVVIAERYFIAMNNVTRIDGKSYQINCINSLRNGIFTDIKCFVEVERETVGQYTGLIDKNDKQIFEGDILSAYLDDLFLDNETRVEVRWKDFAWKTVQYNFSDGSEEFDDLEEADGCIWEVIGNIYDNPEFIKNEVM